MVELRKICIISGSSLPPPPVQATTCPYSQAFSSRFPSPLAGGPPAPPGLPPFFAPFADFARGFPDLGTRFRRFFQALEATFADFSRHWKRVFLPLFLLLPSCRARLEAAPPEGVVFASGGAASCRAAGRASRPGEPHFFPVFNGFLSLCAPLRSVRLNLPPHPRPLRPPPGIVPPVVRKPWVCLLLPMDWHGLAAVLLRRLG